MGIATTTATLLGDNLVLLVLLCPLIGAALLIPLSRLGIHAVQRAALVNVTLTFALSLLIVFVYDPHASGENRARGSYQMTSELAAPREPTSAMGDQLRAQATTGSGPNIRLAAGVDGVSLWFLLLTSTLAIPAIHAVRGEARAEGSREYAFLLCLQAALIGVYTALDVIFFCACLQVVVILFFFLIGSGGGGGGEYQRRAAVRRLFAFHYLAALLVLFGMIGLVLAYSWMTRDPTEPPQALTFSIPELVDNIPQRAAHGGLAGQYWGTCRDMIFAALCLGFAIPVPLLMLHAWLPSASDTAPTGANILLLGSWVPTGCYGMARFLLPLFPTSLPDASGSLSFIAIAGVAYAALLAWTQADLKKLATWSAMSQQNLCIAGLLSLNLVGVSGGLLHAFGQALCTGALIFVIGGLRTQRGQVATRTTDFGPRVRFCLIFLALAIAGAPGLSGFAGAALTLLGILRGHPAVGTGTGFVFCALLGCLLLCTACVAAVSRLRDGERHMQRRRGAAPVADLTLGEIVALLPALALIVAIGVWPNFFLDRTQPTASRLLSAYGTAFTEQLDESSAEAGDRPAPTFAVDRHEARERE